MSAPGYSVWRGSALAATTSALTTTVSAPLVRRAMVRFGALDVPNHRSSHTTVIPRGGGLACLAGMGVGTLVVARQTRNARTWLPWPLVVAPVTMAGIGFLDDYQGGVDPRLRLGSQVASGMVAACSGVPRDVMPVAAIALPGIVNVVNFMDGINGISGLTSVVWGANAVHLAARHRDIALATIGAVCVGCGVGFLPWNAPKAQLFLGDVGSYLLGGAFTSGIICATRPLTGRTWRHPWREAYRAAAPLLPYAADAAQAIIRRRRAGYPFAEAHREHIYQRLVDQHGFSHLASAATHAAVATGVALASRLPRPAAAAVTTGLVVSYLALPQLLGRLRRKQEKSA